jgi:hypothetical protein
MTYYTDAGPRSGPLRHGDAPDAIGVLEAPDKPKPIGTAMWAGKGAGGVVLWRLNVHGLDVPDLWFVVDRQFWPWK